MKHSTATSDPAGDRQGHRGVPITVLSGLPGPVRLAVVAVIAVVVGFAGLSHAGILAPQFRATGSGGGGAVPPQVGPPGTESPPGVQVGWTVLENLSWRAWEVNVVDAPRQDGLNVSAFLEPPGGATFGYPERLSAAARNPGLTRLPVAVPAGGRLVVVAISPPGACAPPGPPPSRPPKLHATVHMSSPLGDRSVDASMFVGPAPPCPA